MQNETKPQPTLTQYHIDKFWSKVDKIGPDDCWIWKSWRNNRNYGMFQIKKTKWVASRISYFIEHGELPQHLDVCHKCDNPPCVNPAHLFLGTAKDNADDMFKKGRNRVLQGEDAPKVTLTEFEVLQIRRIYSSGDMNTVELAKAYGVFNTTIHSVLSGKTWRHITNGVSIVKRACGERNGFAKLDEPKIKEIRSLRSKGITMQAIANQFHIGRTTVAHIVYGRHWKHVI